MILTELAIRNTKWGPEYRFHYLLEHDDIKTTLDTYTHFGYTDVQVEKLEDYYNAVKMQSESNIIAFKHA